MRVRWGLVGGLVLAGLVEGCSLEPQSLRVEKSATLQASSIKTIAILPVESAPARVESADEPGVDPAQASGAVDSGALLTDMLYSEMRQVPQWTLIPQPQIQAASGGLSEIDPKQAQEIGARVNADAVLFGRVTRYRERSGRGWGSEQPASVAFSLFLLDIATGKRIWSARFDEAQQALSENLLNIGKFIERRTRFVRADELAREGVTTAVAELQKTLAQ